MIQKIFSEPKQTSKYYSLLASFDEQLKKHSIKISQPTTTIEIVPVVEAYSPVPTTSTIEYESSITEVQETIEYLLNQCCTILSETLVRSVEPKPKRQEKIVRLERKLSRLSRIIRELEEKDMSLDEMAHCDLYEIESKLKAQACSIHEKLSKLKSQSATAERIIQKPIVLNGISQSFDFIFLILIVFRIGNELSIDYERSRRDGQPNYISPRF